MPKLSHRQLILAAIEDSYQSEATIEGSNAILVGDLEWSHEGARMNERERVRWPSKGTLAHVYGGTLMQLSFNAELKGSGTAGEAPEWGVLMRMCGMAETISAGTSVEYSPASLDNESGTIHYYEGSTLRKLVGCRGTWELSSEVGNAARIAFTITGHLVDPDPEDAEAPEPTFDDTVPSTFRGAAVDLGGFTPIVSNLTITLNNEVATPASANSADGFGEIVINGRDPTASIDPESVDVATKNLISAWKDGEVNAFDTGVIGDTPGNQWQITAPAAVMREIGPGDRDGIRTRELTLGLAEDTGDDELTISLT